MPTTLTTTLADARSRLDETTARFWQDSELTTWINEACRDIARRCEVLRALPNPIAVTAGTAKYAMPANLIQIHRVEFTPTGNTNVYLVEPKTREEMDQYWGWLQQTSSNYPLVYVEWGIVGGVGNDAATLQLYPVPSQNGSLQIYSYRLPVAVVAPSDNLDIPEGWQDLVPLYCEYVAKRKLRDASWQDAKQLYEDSLQHMVEVTRNLYADQSQSMMTPRGMVPTWLYGGEDW